MAMPSCTTLNTEYVTREVSLCMGVHAPAVGLGRGSRGQRFLEGKGERPHWLWPAWTPCDFRVSLLHEFLS